MSRTGVGLAAACAAAGLAGYLLAYQPVAVAEKAAVVLAANVRAEDRRSARDAARPEAASIPTVRTPKQLAALKEDLLGRFRTSPSAFADWTLRGQAAALLSTMTPGELQGFADELTPSGGGRSGAWSQWKTALLREVFRQWGLKDPAAACLGLGRPSFMFQGEAFDDWMRRDPEAAKAWVTRGLFPPSKEKEGKRLQQDFLNRQASTDLSMARESLAMLDAEAQNATLLEWSARLANDPAKRDELLLMVASRGDPEFTQKCYERLVREMAVKSPQEASKFLESSNLPDETKYALSNQMLGEWASQDPHKAFAAWKELKEDEAPKPLLKAMNNWSMNSPGAEEAIDWVMKLDAGPAREQFKQHLIGNMCGGERYGQAADLASSLDDSVERLRQMKIVKRRWEEKFPDWANGWFGKLSQEDKDAMEKKLE